MMRGWIRRFSLGRSSPEICVGSAGPFAGKPAPTGIALHLWERVYPRKGQHSRHQFNCVAPSKNTAQK
ncbi:protein of unknown function [Pseudomonas sp. JV551A1]|nr:protein of unknown function [Pseudomonas sp. JV551A1]